jgi:hypothetical protein
MEFYGVFVADWIWMSFSGFCLLCLFILTFGTGEKHELTNVNIFTHIGTYTGLWLLLQLLLIMHIDLYDWTIDLNNFLEDTWFPDYWMFPADWASRLLRSPEGWEGIIVTILSPAIFAGAWAVSILIGYGPLALLGAWALYSENNQRG